LHSELHILAQIPHNHKVVPQRFRAHVVYSPQVLGACLIGNVPLPVSGKVHGLPALQRQRRYAVHLIAIRDAAVSSGSELS